VGVSEGAADSVVGFVVARAASNGGVGVREDDEGIVVRGGRNKVVQFVQVAAPYCR